MGEGKQQKDEQGVMMYGCNVNGAHIRKYLEKSYSRVKM